VTPGAPLLVAGLAAAAVPLVAGWPFSALLPRLLRRSLASRLAGAWLLGAAWCGLSALALSGLLGLPFRRATLLPAVLAPFLVAFAVRRSALLPLVARRASTPALAAFAIAAPTCALLAVRGLVSIRDGWDARMTWAPQARLMRIERTATPAVFRDARALVYHPRYPPLVSLVQVTALEIVGAPDDPRCGGAVPAAFFSAFLALLHRGVRLLARDAFAAAGAVALAATTPFLAFADDGGAAGGYSDLPLAAFLGGALLLCLSACRACGGAALGLLLAGAALTKNEGLPLALGLSSVGLLLALAGARGAGSRARRARARRVARVAAPAAALLLAAVVLLQHWRSGIPNRYDEAYGEVLAGLRLESGAVARELAVVAPRLGSEFVTRSRWGRLWSALAVLVLLGARRLGRRAALAPAALVLGPMAIGVAAYVIGTDPVGLANGTWPRFLVQGSFGTFLLVGLLAARAGASTPGPASGSAAPSPRR
jgi:hypothetical protein